ncbi:MAG: hypothetical protein ACP59X_12145 [Solidesulfovibrio sp. DCME]|uniref:hypothetical protein n=1 Tax=Solidesulfovibrio sp. DCME TaxID=3447380 RepID=UPI003D0D4B59
MENSTTYRCPGCKVEFNVEDIAGKDTCPVCGRPFFESGLGMGAPPLLGDRKPAKTPQWVYWGIAVVMFGMTYLSHSLDREVKKTTNPSPVREKTLGDALETGSICRTMGGHFFSLTENGLAQLYRMHAQGDKVALYKAMDLHGNGILAPGKEVYIDESGWSVIRIRPRGQTAVFWTVREAVDCK